MRFYRIEVPLLADYEKEEKQRHKDYAYLKSNPDFFFVEQEKSCRITVSNLMYQRKKAVLCGVVLEEMILPETVKEFMKDIGIEVELSEMSEIVFKEITLEAYSRLMYEGGRANYIKDEDDIFDRLGISNLTCYRHRNGLRFTETMLEGDCSKRELLHKIKGLLCDDSLQLEIERIFQGTRNRQVIGHPVHYLLQSDDREIGEEMRHSLFKALYMTGRIKSQRYAEVSLDDNSHLPGNLQELYNACTGSVVVISIADQDKPDSSYARNYIMDKVREVCAIMRRNRNQVLTVFSIQGKAEKIKNLILEHLGAITIVPIAQATVYNRRAKEYLKACAKKHNIIPDRILYRPITAGKAFTAEDLNLVFEQWYDKQLKNKVYTQYAEFDAADQQVSVRKPKGMAIDELEQMIGLAEAKAIIHQALDFYKAQKLFRGKGFPTERPAMHMVFTGNPGTAKTSVARLFAQIMKDNGLLSVGNLYEVGRADLVGKYVGWTAAIVKEKFKLARGSVLFIDEAYSLVDDKEGLFGDEAINTIVQEMEHYREDMVVIFAGYPDKMEHFLQKNPGLRSRLAFHVPFTDYTAEELYEITELLSAKKKLILDEGVRHKLLPAYEAAMAAEDFGNGRFARNVLEAAIMKQASRLVRMDVDDVTRDDIQLLVAEDFEIPSSKNARKATIGFDID